jgi:osmotically inducible protein OsmC
MWEGNLKQGHGTISLGANGFQVPYDFATRFGDSAGSNPEELIGGAHAGCFSMALAHALGEAGYSPERIHTIARVHLEKGDGGFSIPKIELESEAEVPGIDNDMFQRLAHEVKLTCPVSEVLSVAEITLEAELLSSG